MINISEEKNPELYSKPIDICLGYLKNLSCEKNKLTEKVKFHTYWFVGKDFGRKQTLVIKSYLASQDLNNTEFILWSNKDLSNNEFLKPFLPYISLRIYNPQIESINTPIQNRMDIFSLNDPKNWSGGDLFRLLVLHNYGGIYVDMDMVFLRDFTPLFENEFMYKWGCKDEWDPQGINGACMCMHKKSRLTYDLLMFLSQMPLIPESTYWSNELYKVVRNYNKNWSVFPSAFFNSEWQDDDKRNWGSDENNAFIECPYKLYEGAFTWHWHNRWDDEIHPNSKWAYMEKIMEEKYPKNIQIFY